MPWKRTSWFHPARHAGKRPALTSSRNDAVETDCLTDAARGICCSATRIQMRGPFPLPNHSVNPRELSSD